MIGKIRENKFIYNILLFIYFYAKTAWYNFFLLFFSLFKIDNRKIIILNFGGKWYWDNGKYISKELMKYDYKIYWATKKEFKNSLPKWINYVEFDSIKYLYHLATAKVWINNNRFWWLIRKRKTQFYVQTWHGCIGFKKSEADTEKTLSIYYVLSAKNDSKMADLFISNSTFCTNYYRNYYWYNGNILEYGCPRNDIIINNDTESIEKVQNYFWFSDKEKICLYAPTFRENFSLDTYNIEYKTLIKNLNNKFGSNWKLLIRLHPLISNLSNQLLFNEQVINASNYPDMQELLVASDFMITDYSSCIFDYALTGKPAIIYASDIEEYKKDRDFAIKFEDSPFPITTNNIELENIIKNFNMNEYLKRLNKFYENNGLKETGKSCEKIVEIINKITKDKKNS